MNWFNRMRGFILFVVLVLAACSSNDKTEVISSEEFLPQAKKEYTDSMPKDTIPKDRLNKSDSIQLMLKQQIPTLQFTDSNALYDPHSNFIPNQLGFDAKAVAFFSIDNVPYHYLSWKFKDSLNTINAFYNWMDCFGANCKSIRINETVNASKNAFLIFESNNEIIYLESHAALDLDFWKEKLVQSSDKDKWNFILIQAPNRKIKWVNSINQKEKE